MVVSSNNAGLPPRLRVPQASAYDGVLRMVDKFGGDKPSPFPQSSPPPAAAHYLIPHKDLPPGARYSRVHIDRLIHYAGFPRPVRVSSNRLFWWSDEIAHWLETRPRDQNRRKAALGPRDARNGQPDVTIGQTQQSSPRSAAGEG
jgi:hypothetical protein